MSSVAFEPTISAGKWLQTHALDRAATRTGTLHCRIQVNLRSNNYRVTASVVSPSKSNTLDLDYQHMFEYQQIVQAHVFKLML